MQKKPLREVIAAPLDRAFRVYSHGYPFQFSGWHYHPEYELHAIRRSSGLCYIGTYAGPFETGNLILTGPNLPHVWVTDADGYGEGRQGDFIPDRDLVMQFSGAFAEKCLESFADCADLRVLLAQASAGILFSEAIGEPVARMMEELRERSGPGRLALFFDILDRLLADKARQPLSVEWQSYQCLQPKRLDNILKFIAENYNRADLTCGEVARREAMELSAFSRFFERHISCTCIEYINRLRIYKACQLLIETENRITMVAYEVGYDTLSTFNRNFQRYIGSSPSAFRAHRRYGLMRSAHQIKKASAGGA
ncbi:AraC family transcriptional regulator [Rhodospirillum rubrum]|uniref:AraC family transcriptional regulator n=1 Tax=Rhodospirillum rubrum TaxID=1085 RepID=UPI001902ECEA|nr:helix-turn-helix domain-containing protein [Rhodospirillum rubrum]MBK1664887.1 AraC family transcriptional regulator [Rhodospirillum rubrum]MBK1676808.1 AraC family transcriptional regulator [Rhodospirillum rubrum]